MTAFPNPSRRRAMAALGSLTLAPMVGRTQTFPIKPSTLIGALAGGTGRRETR